MRGIVALARPLDLLFAWLVIATLLGSAVGGAGSDFFSEHGGLVAADSADKAARSGGLIVAAKGDKCAVLVSYSSDKTAPTSASSTSSQDSSPVSRLMRQSRNDRVRLLDSSTVMASVGMVSDANFLADNLFEEITQHKFVFGSDLPVARLAKTLSILVHSQTLQRNSRPFGVHTCLVGLNSYDHPLSPNDTSNIDPWGLYEVDVLGNIFPCKWTCLGPREAAKCVVGELGKARADIEGTTDAQELLKTCVACLRSGLSIHKEEEQDEDGERERVGQGVSLRSHELQAAVLALDSSASSSHRVKILTAEEMETLLSETV